MSEDNPNNKPQTTTTLSKPKKVGIGLAAGIALCCSALLIVSEGKRNVAYLDVTKTPTICYGETAGVSMGQTATDQTCINMLQKDIGPRVAAMQACTSVDVKPEVAAAMIDFGYNAGVSVYCQNPAKLINQGQTVAACNWLGVHYTTSKGKLLRGLVLRRAREKALCLKGTGH